MEKTKNNTEKPNWLLNLEQESWQAELIISGVENKIIAMRNKVAIY